ncbi:DUF222 domain-containing protein [Kineosporia sp. J2-2]|uniref:DUF222 domain-containing protein n=1 Tax=Kineosporia corallincola TaxID=2835133 RepID=A0ABS5THW6_9ACTN|nr:HNH endonuclease signature motif containing protein [Kineosporia corallincola]MBT0770689.1 DUF222 domain-containing protein [Kineosporia corallincola]
MFERVAWVSSGDAGVSARGCGALRTVLLSAWPEVDLHTASAGELLSAVQDMPADQASENRCLGVVVASEKLIRQLNALQARHLNQAARLAAQAQSVPADATCDPIDGIASVASELSLALGWARKTATDRVGNSVLLSQELPDILALVEEGELDFQAAVSVHTQMRNCLEPGTALWRRVQAALVKLLPGKSVQRAIAATQRELQKVDPQAAQKRHEESVKSRYVRAFPLTDGMGGLDIRLRADAVALIDAQLDALADGCRDAARRAGTPDRRTHQQRRTDALVGVFRAIHDQTPLPLLRHSAGDTGSHDKDTFGGRFTSPSHFSPKPSSSASHPRSTRTDPVRKGVLGWWLPPKPPTQQGRRPHLVVTISAQTLLGLDNLPGELQSFGSVPADLAREIARQAGRITVIPLRRSTAAGKMMSQVSRPAVHGPGDQANCTESSLRYKPRQSVIDKVVARFQHCSHPGCSQKATRCDIDHAIPFAKGGFSCPCNLVPLCRFHHRLKTHGGWRLRLTGPGEPHPEGTIEWRSRLGQRHFEPPPPLPGASDDSSPDDDADPFAREQLRHAGWESELRRITSRRLPVVEPPPPLGDPPF